jgi:hypothetical protein
LADNGGAIEARLPRLLRDRIEARLGPPSGTTPPGRCAWLVIPYEEIARARVQARWWDRTAELTLETHAGDVVRLSGARKAAAVRLADLANAVPGADGPRGGVRGTLLKLGRLHARGILSAETLEQKTRALRAGGRLRPDQRPRG